MQWVGKLYGLSSGEVLRHADAHDLGDLLSKSLRSLSTGERKKVGIALSLLHRPNFLLLDEPTSSLDPFVRQKVWKHLLLSNAAILFSTHIWKEAQDYAQSILFLYQGKLLAPKISVYDALQLLPSKEKLILPKEKSQHDFGKDYFSYTDDSHFYIVGDVSKLLHSMKDLIGVAYSRVATDLEDVYQFLITTSNA